MSDAAQIVIAQINEKIQPLDRGDRYEDPLDGALKEAELGSVCGAGTMLSELGEIEHCDVEIEVTAGLEAAIARIKSFLEAQGAPVGSKLLVGGEVVAFGKAEGLGLYLNGTDLPDSVYEACDLDTIVDELTRLLGDAGELRGDWQGPTESALYLYGASFEEMRRRIAPFVDSYPLCQKSRLVRIA